MDSEKQLEAFEKNTSIVIRFPQELLNDLDFWVEQLQKQGGEWNRSKLIRYFCKAGIEQFELNIEIKGDGEE